MNFNERAVPGLTANFLMQEAYARYAFALKYISEKTSVIDLACGTGYGTHMLAQKAKAVVGIDIDSEAISSARKNFTENNTTFIQMDVMQTFFKQNAFQYAVAFEMIEHLKKPNLFLKEVHRILNRDGIFIVSTPNSLVQSPDGILMSAYHEKEYTPEELISLLKTYFRSVTLVGQQKSKNAKQSVDSFMQSQRVRQFLVDMDIFQIRKLFEKDKKEYIWKYIGNFFGRNAQEKVKVNDFKFSKTQIQKAEYLIAICRK